MSSKSQFDGILEAIWQMDVAKQINKLLDKMGTPPLDLEGLDRTIEDLSPNAHKALVQAVKRKEINKIVGILGIKPITYVDEKE
jgi:hypothetical protein